MLKKDTKIFLAGHKGLLGSSVLRVLKRNKFKNIIIVDKKVDLRNQSKVFSFLKLQNLKL